MVVKNSLSNDARVKKEIRALHNDGWKITVIAMPETGAPEREVHGHITIIRPLIRSDSAEKLRATVHRASETTDLTVRAKLIRALRRNRLRRFFADLARDIPWEMRLRREALQTKADVYHAHDLDTLQICGLAAEKTGARLIYDSHELWLESSRYHIATGRMNRIRLRSIEQKYAPAADAVISVTPMRGEKMLEMYPNIRRMEIIENAPETIRELPAGGRLRKMLKVEDSVPIALYQGVICPERGLEELVEAAALLKEKNLVFAVIGMDAWNGTLHEMVKSRKLENVIKILPPVPSEELPEITADADMGFILFRNTCLNHYYSLPNKLYEYMMSGVPVISSGFPELKLVIEEAKSGITVDPENPADIARGIFELLENPELRKQMAQSGREAAVNRFNWEPQKKKLQNLYREILMS
ncbi:hypothetical protein CSA37_05380 [Candidatus Fermentibacteria bacterium]|nr:MAG: hypothetical protein CSA37_05380 [Candidatus Fermentibacteria bacterium]